MTASEAVMNYKGCLRGIGSPTTGYPLRTKPTDRADDGDQDVVSCSGAETCPTLLFPNEGADDQFITTPIGGGHPRFLFLCAAHVSVRCRISVDLTGG